MRTVPVNQSAGPFADGREPALLISIRLRYSAMAWVDLKNRPGLRHRRFIWTSHRRSAIVLWHAQRSVGGAVGGAAGHARPDDPQDAAGAGAAARLRPGAAD